MNISIKETFLVILLCFVFSTIIVDADRIDIPAGHNPCSNKGNCRECIQTSGCVWCLDPDFDKNLPRCYQPSTMHKNLCPENMIYNPDQVYQVLKAEKLSRRRVVQGGGGGQYVSGGSMSYNESYQGSMHATGSAQSGSEFHGSASGGGSFGSASASGSMVQISPQHISLKCKINEPCRLNVSYSQAEDYPVDLYYLMDLSKSMEDDKAKLSALGDTLTSTMKRITSNFRLGFGSFVDKVLMPYVSTVPKKLEQPCDGCAAPYGYRNQMKLSTNFKEFSRQVNDASVSGNLDAPEGGFDAIMQAIVCKNEIGWQKRGRRLLVFSTDAGFHYAGDGKLGGVITPNDGECHMDRSGLYTHSSLQDYPSISQINLKVKQNAINIIFAVTQEQIHVYKKLSEHIEGSSSAILSNDSSNIVELIQKEYNKITESVEMKDTASSAMKINYYSSCLKNGASVPTNKCDGLKVGDVVEFTAEILLTSCPANPKDWKQTFKIYPVGLLDDALTVDLEMLCDCPCERPENIERNSDKCNNKGTYSCGICECNKNNFGRNCECSLADAHLGIDLNQRCRPNNLTLVDCSGRGTCVCGVCECERRSVESQKITGKYCECDNLSCARHDGLVCSGPNHGTCECNVCKCLPGFKGDACECPSSDDVCRNKATGKICSGHGTCNCGKCECSTSDDEGGRYSGEFCEKCPTCAGRCNEFRNCVQCQMYKTGPLKNEDDCSSNCTLFIPTPVETVEVDEELDEQLCQFYDEDDCKFKFVYSEKEPGKVVVRAQKERECPPKVFIIGIVLAVIAAIVLIGLAILLLWKFITTIHDQREFARFERERMMAKWDTGENPIYKQATSTFKNPTYAGK